MLERRLHRRKTVNLPARLVDENDCITTCRVLDVSENGARIRLVPRHAFLPNTFTLAVGTREGPARRVEVIWRDGAEAGVYFPPEAELSTSGVDMSATSPAVRAKAMSVAELRKLVK